MKDDEDLSGKHFNGQAAIYVQRDAYSCSQNGKISCRGIAEQVKSASGCELRDRVPDRSPSCANNARECGLDLSDEMIRVA